MRAHGHSSIDEALKASTEANHESVSYADWHSSAHHPEKLFSRFLSDIIQNNLTAQEVCNGLSQLSDEDLTLFENELKKPENRIAVEPCYTEQDERLEKYWTLQHQTSSLESDSENINSVVRFKTTEVQLRDVSQGYYAVTGDLQPKQVVLTFDDGPDPNNTLKILDTLKKANVRVIFFHQGQNVRRHPHIVQKVAEGGHSIGSHSITHACLPTKNLCRRSNGGHILSYSEALEEIRGGHQAIFDAIGWVDPFFRFPYGESSVEMKDFLRKKSVGEFLWNVDSEDWRNKLASGEANTPATLIESVMTQLKPRGRGIILFHDIQRRTAEALPAVLKRLFDEGYQPVVFQAKDPQARFNSQLVGPRRPVD